MAHTAADSLPPEVEAPPSVDVLSQETPASPQPELPEPLTVAVERRLIEGLVQASADRAEAERRIEADFTANSQQADREFAEARRSLAANYESELQAAAADFDRTRRKILTTYESEFGPTERDFVQLQHRCQTEFTQNTSRAKRKLKDRRWEADTIFDATKDGPGKRLEEFRKTISVVTASLRTLAEQSTGLLLRWRQGWVLESPIEPAAIAEGETFLTLQEHLRRAETEHFELTQLSVPPWFQGARLAWVFIGLWGLLVAPAWWLAGPHGLWIALIGAAILGIALTVWLGRVARTQVARVYPRLAGTLAHAELLKARLVAEAEDLCKRQEAEIAERRDRDMRTAEEKFHKKIADINERHDSELSQAKNYYPQRLKEITARRDTALAAADAENARRAAELQQRHEIDSSTLQENYRIRVAAVKAAHMTAWQELTDSWRNTTEELKSLVARIHGRDQELFPDWASLAGFDSPLADRSPPAIRFGQFEVDMVHVPGGIPVNTSLAAMTPARLTLPALLSFPDQASLLVKARGPGRALAVETLQSVMLRLLTALPPGKVRFTIIDPVGLGENFAAFMHLADYDESLVANRIWTEPRHIEQRLADLSEHMENVIQKYLRNEFESIEDYNAYAGEIAEPFRFLVIANFPVNFTEDATRRLLSIVGSGARCGVNTLISVDMQADLPREFQLRDLEQASTVLLQKKDGPVWKHDLFGQFPLAIEKPPTADDCTRILHTVGRYAKDAGKVEVPFEFIAPSVDQCWKSDSRRGIDVPLGRAGATRLQHLRLGHGTSQHVLVAGQTGSGKSTLLHALITNLALRYSPDEVALYLVDFKKGVEFKTYATHNLPHARVVAIESDREFGLSVLERLDAELKIRADRFRDLGVQDIAGYREAVTEALPRIMLIIDEFQELFTEDDKIAQSGALLLDRLVRQGRAFGMHLLLGSQTLGGAYSLARSTIGQIGVRIALRCSEIDAHLILSEENSAARLLSRAGEAIYNDMNGMIEGNHPFQVVWLADEPREAYLECVQEMARQYDRGRPWPQVVFEGNVPAEPQKNVALDSFLRGTATPTHATVQAWLGESVSIKDPTSAVFRPQSGSNLLIAGQNDEGALGITAAAMVSLLAQMRTANVNGDTAPRLFLLDGAPAGSPESAALAELAKFSERSIKLAGWRDLGDVMSQLAVEVERRSQPGHEHHEPMFLIVYGLQRFRDLRKPEDDFGFGRMDENKPPNPAKQFATILREGPSLGIHTIVWCDSLNNLNRSFDRQTMREFEMRAVFQMSSGDSSTLIDTPVAGKLGPYRALYFSEEQGCLEKFRPYGFPSGEWLAWAAQQISS